jgi:hypothetical protein
VATVAALREAFARWGRPARPRFDNGQPWGSKGDLPTPLGLWLMGLAVAPVSNPPRRPKANAVVERSQGVGQRWADPATCADAAALQAAADAMDEHQRTGFPEPGASRMRRFPALAHSGRAYDPDGEGATWDVAAMRHGLSGYAASRRVSARGAISVYDRGHSVGRRYAGEAVYVRCDPEGGDWLFELAAGPVIGRAPSGLTREAILAWIEAGGKPPVAADGET